jgi:SET domain-containing protein
MSPRISREVLSLAYAIYPYTDSVISMGSDVATCMFSPAYTPWKRNNIQAQE